MLLLENLQENTCSFIQKETPAQMFLRKRFL